MPSNSIASEKRYPPFRSAFAQGLLLLAAMAAVFLAGNLRQGATGVFFTMAGALMVFLAPNRVVPWQYWLLSGAMLVSAMLCLLPQAWFYAPPWRVGLQEFQGLPDLPYVTLALRETVYWIILLAGAIMIGLFSLGHPVRSGVKVYLGCLGTMACAAYAGISIYAKHTGWEFPFFDKNGWSPPDFGFFPNRNHTAALLVTGAILALGVIRDAWASRRPLVFVLAGGSLALCVHALLFYSISRGGVVFLIVGVVLWVAFLGRSHISIPLLVSSLVVGVVLVGLFLATEGMARDRVLELIGVRPPTGAINATDTTEPGDKTPAAFSDFRMNIFQDAWRIVRDYPLTGVGLGTFGYVSPFYVNASIGEAIPIHPESDWLMAATESGLLFPVFALALLFILLRDLFSFRKSATWPLRWGLASAALVAVLHATVDVPLHRVELGWWVLALTGLAFGNPSPTGTERNASWIVQRLVFGAAGAGLFAMGLLLIRAQWFGETPFPPYRAALVVNQMRQLAAAGKFQEAVVLARSEIPLSPMAVGLYRELGYRVIKNGGNPEVADAVFAAERALNPVSAQLAFDQGLLWLGDDPKRSAVLWADALKKSIRIKQGGGYARPDEFYSRMLSMARQNPEMLKTLEACSQLSPELWLVWISQAKGDRLEEVAKNKDFLDSLDANERRKFVSTWWHSGNKESLEQFLNDNPHWQDAAWGLRVRQMVALKDFKGAVEAARERYSIDLELPKITPEAEAATEPPLCLANRVAYFAARGNLVSARRMISESTQAREPEGFRLQCVLALRAGDWPSAWKAMESYLRLTKRGDLP